LSACPLARLPACPLAAFPSPSFQHRSPSSSPRPLKVTMPPSPQPSSNPHALSTSNPGASSSTPDFKFPPYHVSYPPFFTLQPTVTTRLAQLHKWSLLIQRYCAHYRLFRLSITSAATLDSPLFHNVRLRKRMSAAHVRAVFAWMAGKDGGNRAEWIGGNEEGGNVWVFWRRPEEWAEVLSGWVSIMVLERLCFVWVPAWSLDRRERKWSSNYCTRNGWFSRELYYDADLCLWL
jgi:ESCRT-II complex subunit VPS25